MTDKHQSRTLLTSFPPSKHRKPFEGLKFDGDARTVFKYYPPAPWYDKKIADMATFDELLYRQSINDPINTRIKISIRRVDLETGKKRWFDISDYCIEGLSFHEKMDRSALVPYLLTPLPASLDFTLNNEGQRFTALTDAETKGNENLIKLGDEILFEVQALSRLYRLPLSIYRNLAPERKNDLHGLRVYLNTFKVTRIDYNVPALDGRQGSRLKLRCASQISDAFDEKLDKENTDHQNKIKTLKDVIENGDKDLIKKYKEEGSLHLDLSNKQLDKIDRIITPESAPDYISLWDVIRAFILLFFEFPAYPEGILGSYRNDPQFLVKKADFISAMESLESPTITQILEWMMQLLNGGGAVVRRRGKGRWETC